VISGSSCSRGSERLVLDVAGLAVAVEANGSGMRLCVRGSSVKFLENPDLQIQTTFSKNAERDAESETVSVDKPAKFCGPLARPENPDLLLRAAWRELGPDPQGSPVFDSGGAWRLFRRNGCDIYRCYASDREGLPYKEARIPLDGGAGQLLLDPRAFPAAEPVDALEFPLDELLFLRLLAAHGGIELHAAGIIAPSGRGYLFAGQSGDGKSTTSHLWQDHPGTTVLSDDRIILRPAPDGAWWMHGTPWHGEAELAANARAPLAAVLLLGRGTSNALEPLAPAAAMTALLARSFVSFHDAGIMEQTLALLADLVRDVPCLRYSFVPGADAVRFVLENLP